MAQALIGAQPTHDVVRRNRGGKYLVFHLGKEEFGAHVLKVREIIGLQELTAVPHTPHYVKGVINLRGKVIAVIDLRIRFGLPEKEYDLRTCIIVLDVRMETGAIIQMGVVVDGVSEVLTVNEAEVEDTPDFGEDIKTPYIIGMAKVKNKVKILLDIDQVLTSREIRGLEMIAPMAE